MWWILGQNSIFADKIWYLCVFICALSNYWTWLGDNWLCCLEIQYKLYWFRVLSLRFDRKSPKIGGLPFFGCLTVCEGAMVSGEWYFRYLDMIDCLKCIHLIFEICIFCSMKIRKSHQRENRLCLTYWNLLQIICITSRIVIWSKSFLLARFQNLFCLLWFIQHHMLGK